MKKLTTLFVLLFALSNINAQQLSTLNQSTKRQEVKNVSANDFYKLLKEIEKPQLIDIRTPGEYKSGHIRGAKLINFYDSNFMKNIEKAELNKEQSIFIYCRSGHRSKASIKFFKELGFKKIINLARGINDWYQNKLPVKN